MEQKIQCYILEDEEAAVSVLKKHIARLSDILELVGHTGDFVIAKSILDGIKIDILFLDMRLPKTTGFKFLDIIEQKPKVILTTAHAEYALESYDYNVIAYLKKPFSFEQFEKAVFKAIGTKEFPSRFMPPKGRLQTESFFLIGTSEKGKSAKVNFEDIIFIEAINKSVLFKTKNGEIASPNYLSVVEESLPQNIFIRISKSCIVNVNYVIEIGKEFVKLKEIDKTFPIGGIYRLKFHERMHNAGIPL
jgi:DNA-binding LytR/AlgR family response regulator